MHYLASPASAEVWVPNGGLPSPNSGVDTSLYPDDISRQIAESLVEAETFRFDMSDLAPSAFGCTEGQGEWKLMIDFLQNPDNIESIQEQLDSASESAYN